MRSMLFSVALFTMTYASAADAPSQDCATCKTAKEKDGWCEGCKAGYVGGQKTTCKGCFGLMASKDGGWCEGCKVGHAKGVKTSCKSCLDAIKIDAWCDNCGAGYVNAQKTKCKGCFDLMKSKDGGWCEGCKVGYAKGVKTSCKSCLDAIKTDAWCDNCGAGYVNAQKTQCKGCFGLMKSKDGGWCDDCKVGHAKGLKTKCPKCFEAIQKDGACADCNRSFKGGVGYKTVFIHVHDLDNAEASAKVKAALEKVDGVGSIRIDIKAGRTDVEVKETSATKVGNLVEALKKAGFEGHEGKE